MSSPPIARNSQVSVNRHYQHVIDSVIRNLSATFLDAGIDKSVLVDLGVQWRKNLADMGTVTDFIDPKVMEESQFPAPCSSSSVPKPAPPTNEKSKWDPVYILPPTPTAGIAIHIQPVDGVGDDVTVTVPVAAIHGGILKEIISVPGLFDVSGEQDVNAVVQSRVNQELINRGYSIAQERAPKKGRGIGRRGRGRRGVTTGRGRGRGRSSKIATSVTSDEDESDVDYEPRQSGRGRRGAVRGRGRGRPRKVSNRVASDKEIVTIESDKEESGIDDEQEVKPHPGRGGRGAARGRGRGRGGRGAARGRGRGRGRPSKISTRATSGKEEIATIQSEQEIKPGRGGGKGRGRPRKVSTRVASDKEIATNESGMDGEEEIKPQPGRGKKGAARGRGRGRGRGRSSKLVPRASGDMEEGLEIKSQPARGGSAGGKGRGRKRGLEQIPQLDGGLDSDSDSEYTDVDEEEEEMKKAASEYQAYFGEQRERMLSQNNMIICQYEKIIRKGYSWKFVVKDGIMKINGKDYIFGFGKGETGQAPEIKPVGWTPKAEPCFEEVPFSTPIPAGFPGFPFPL